jgi:hypothetical protein
MLDLLLNFLGALAVPLLVALNAFFVATEFSLVTVRWTRVEQLVEEKKFGALAVRYVVENLVDSVAATQLGITFTSLALGWVGEPTIAHLIEPWFAGIPAPWNATATHASAIGIAFLAITFMHVVLGELVPKAIALERAEGVALLAAVPLLAFARVARPFIRVMRGAANAVVKSIRLPPVGQRHLVHSVDELTICRETRRPAPSPDEAATPAMCSSCPRRRSRSHGAAREGGHALAPGLEEKVLRRRGFGPYPHAGLEETPTTSRRDRQHQDLFHLFSLKGLVIIMDAMYRRCSSARTFRWRGSCSCSAGKKDPWRSYATVPESSWASSRSRTSWKRSWARSKTNTTSAWRTAACAGWPGPPRPAPKGDEAVQRGGFGS